MTSTPNTIRDERLPQLGVALNTAMMQTVLASALNCPVESCRILQCRYKPTKTCLVSYAVQTPGSRKERIAYVRLYPANESFAHYQKARAHASLSRHVLHIPAFEMVVWAFPNDRKMTSLRDLADEACLRTEILPQVVAEGWGADWHIETLHSEIVHYVAEHTCTVKVQLELRNAATGKTKSPVLFGKTYYNEQGATTFQAMQELQRGGIKIARPLSYQPHLKTLWQLGLEGITLNDLVARDDGFVNLLAQSAVAVAALHKTSLGVPVAHSQEVARLPETARLISLVSPASQPKLESLIAHLQAQAETLAARPAITLHGDLHLKNFFVVNDHMVLIDLDNLSLGDPLQDIGSFIASLLYRHLLGEIPNAKRLINTFINAYQDSVSWPVPEADLHWHIATALITERVSRCVTRLKASHLIDDLMALAARISTGGLP